MDDSRVGTRTHRPTTNDCVIIKLPELKRLGMVKRDHLSRRNLVLSSRETPAARLTIVSDITYVKQPPCLEIAGTAFSQAIDQRIELESLPMRLGGERWYARCPKTGKRYTTLVLPYGETSFASMAGWDVSYLSQRLDSGKRKWLALEKLDQKLEGLSKYTRKPTRRRLEDRIEELEAEACELAYG